MYACMVDPDGHTMAHSPLRMCDHPQLPLWVRRQMLEATFHSIPGLFQVAPAVFIEDGIAKGKWGEVDDGDDSDAVEGASQQAAAYAAVLDVASTAVRWGAEGVMAKPMDGAYRCGTRSRSWMKLKKDFDGSLGGDTLDLVPIGAYVALVCFMRRREAVRPCAVHAHTPLYALVRSCGCGCRYWGKGTRRGVFGSFVMACRDDDLGTFHPVCKLGTGFSENQLLRAFSELQPTDSVDATDAASPPPDMYSHVKVLPKPDVWLRPTEVWEVRASDLTRSRVYSGGAAAMAGSDYTGVGLRFPRLLRLRPDKYVLGLRLALRTAAQPDVRAVCVVWV